MLVLPVRNGVVVLRGIVELQNVVHSLLVDGRVHLIVLAARLDGVEIVREGLPDGVRGR